MSKSRCSRAGTLRQITSTPTSQLALYSTAGSLSALQATARDRKNIFAAVMEVVKTHSLGQISHALYEVREFH